MQKFISIEPMDPGTVHESTSLLQSDRANELFDLTSPPVGNSGNAASTAKIPPITIERGNKGISSSMNTNNNNNNNNNNNESSAVISPLATAAASNAEAPLVTTQLQAPLGMAEVYVPPSVLPAPNPVSISTTPSATKARESRATKEPKSIRK